MKKYTITDAREAVDVGNPRDPHYTDFEISGPEKMQVNDGYHTMDELYEHRITLFIALGRILTAASIVSNFADLPPQARPQRVWRSTKHHPSGENMYPGWFVMGIGKDFGEQITYHLPLTRWDDCYFAETLEHAPQWDGHTPTDVLWRLKNL